MSVWLRCYKNHIPFRSHCINSKFHFDHIFKKEHIPSDYIPKRAHSILIKFCSEKGAFQQEHIIFWDIPNWTNSKKRTVHIPKREHFVLIKFQKEQILFWSHSNLSTVQKGTLQKRPQHSKKGTFRFEHISKRANSKKGKFHFKHIPKRAHSILNTFQKGHIPKRAHSNLITLQFHFDHIPKRAHSKMSNYILITFQNGHIPKPVIQFWTHFKKGHIPSWTHSKKSTLHFDHISITFWSHFKKGTFQNK